jgi:hypothetical protein
MTITADMDARLADMEAQAQLGRDVRGMRWRVGPGALLALVADLGPVGNRDWRPTEYRGIPIETVEAPPDPKWPTRDRFHGFELIA